MEVFHNVKEKGGIHVSFICVNYSVNRSAFSLLGCSGQVYLERNGKTVLLVHDYDHIYKNIRNNWTTKLSKYNVQYIACWNDITKLYDEDKHDPVRLIPVQYNFQSRCFKL